MIIGTFEAWPGLIFTGFLIKKKNFSALINEPNYLK